MMLRSIVFALGLFMLSLLPASACGYGFTVYVYDISNLHKSAGEAKAVCPECVLDQYALDHVLNDFFLQFCGRVQDPELADFFFFPVLQDVNARGSLYGGDRSGQDLKSRLDIVLMEAMFNKNFVPWHLYLKVPDKYWRRYDGADHIVVLPASIDRHQGSKAKKLSYFMLQLERPIFLESDASKSFIAEYGPDCARKNFVMPFPTLDPAFYGALPWKYRIKRKKPLFYQATRSGACTVNRNAVIEVTRNHSLTTTVPASQRFAAYRAHTFCVVALGDNPISKRQYEMLLFGCIPVLLGDDMVYAFTKEAGMNISLDDFVVQLPQSIVQVEANVVSHENVYPRDGSMSPKLGVLPHGTKLEDVVMEVTRKELHSSKTKKVLQAFDFYDGIRPIFPWPNALPETLLRFPRWEVEALQDGVAKHAHLYRYYKTFREKGKPMQVVPVSEHRFPDGDAIDVLAQFLRSRKSEGVTKAAEKCDAFRVQRTHPLREPHFCPVYNSGKVLTNTGVYKPGADARPGIDVVGYLHEERVKTARDEEKGPVTVGADDFIRIPGRSPWTVHTCAICVDST